MTPVTSSTVLTQRTILPPVTSLPSTSTLDQSLPVVMEENTTTSLATRTDGPNPVPTTVTQVTNPRPPTTHNSTVAPVVEPVSTVRTLMAPYTPIQPSLTVASGSLPSTSPSNANTTLVTRVLTSYID